jgi:hypothetical protein
MQHREKLTDEIAAAVSKRLADEGKLIEAGWVILRHMAMARDAPQVQIDEMRLAYMAGAQHVFASIMVTLDPGEEPTDADLRRLDLIHEELEAFREELKLRMSRSKGQA